MKRRIAYLLIFAGLLGLLAGCAVRTDAPQTAPSSDSTARPTDPTAAPAPVPSTEVEAAPGGLQPPAERTVTPGGVAVRTDYGAYTAKDAPVTPKFTRLSAEAMPDLTARDDYGTLYAFVGALYESDFVRMGKYAFADAQGRVVTDPVYNSVAQLRTGDGKKGIWRFTKAFAEMRVDDNGSSYAVNQERCGIATLDGTAVTDCRYERVSAGDRCVMCIYPTTEGETPKFDIYDYDGTLLATSAELPIAGRLYGLPWWFGCVGEYLLVALHSDEYADRGDGVFREVADLYLADPDGTLRLGPFTNVTQSGKYFAVTLKDGTNALLDSEGNYLFGRSFLRIFRNDDDRFTVQKDGSDSYHILDAAGNEIFSYDGTDCPGWDGVGYVCSTSEPFNGGYRRRYYDRDGNELALPARGDWGRVGLTDIFADSIGSGGVVFSLKTGERVELGLGTGFYVEPCDWETPELPYILAKKQVSERNSYCYDTTVYDDRLCEVLRFRGSSFVLRDMGNGTPYFVATENGNSTLYDSKMQPVRTVKSTARYSVMLQDGVLSCFDDRATYIYNPDGTLLLCCPLYSRLDD